VEEGEGGDIGEVAPYVSVHVLLHEASSNIEGSQRTIALIISTSQTATRMTSMPVGTVSAPISLLWNRSTAVSLHRVPPRIKNVCPWRACCPLVDRSFIKCPADV
jgi:hypothetical protein